MLNNYTNKEIEIRFSNTKFNFIAPADPDEVLNSVSQDEFDKDEQLPYWADIWPSSEAIFEYCTKHPIKKGSKICEIGAGLGIISAAISASAKESFLVSTDISKDSVFYIQENLKKNKLKGESACCDWRYSPFKEKFDIIIGADILYEERWAKPVITFIKENLKPDGYALISDPNRKHWQNFKTTAQNEGFNLDSEGVFIQKVQDVSVELIKLTPHCRDAMHRVSYFD